MMRKSTSLMGVVGLALVLAFSTPLALTAPGLAHEGENHGDTPPPPSADLTGILVRTTASGSEFQIVGLPTLGSLTIFVDTVETNIPVAGAYVEVLAGDGAPLVAEEKLPGLYIAAPWPPAGMNAETLAGTEMIVTIAAAAAEELLVVAFPSDETGVAAPGGDPNAAPRKTPATWVAATDSGLRSWLPIVGGIITVAGAVAGFRNRGPGRWIGFSAIAIGLVMGFSTSGLL